MKASLQIGDMVIVDSRLVESDKFRGEIAAVNAHGMYRVRLLNDDDTWFGTILLNRSDLILANYTKTKLYKTLNTRLTNF